MPNIKYKPPTVIAKGPANEEPFRQHATKMTKTYGSVMAINLVNQHGSEGMLCDEFERLVAGVQGSLPFQLKSFDFHKECGSLDYSYALYSPVP